MADQQDLIDALVVEYGKTPQQAEAFVKAHPGETYDEIKKQVEATQLAPSLVNSLSKNGIIETGGDRQNRIRLGEVADSQVKIMQATETLLKNLSVPQLLELKKNGYDSPEVNADGVKTGKIIHYDLSAVGQAALQQALAQSAQSDSSIADIMKNVIKLGKADEINANDIPEKVAAYLKDKYGNDSNVNFSTVQEGISKAIQLTGVPAQVAAQIVQGKLGSEAPGKIAELADFYKNYVPKDEHGNPIELYKAADSPEFRRKWQSLPAPYQKFIAESADQQSKLALINASTEAQLQQYSEQERKSAAGNMTLEQLQKKQKEDGGLPIVQQERLVQLQSQIADTDAKTLQIKKKFFGVNHYDDTEKLKAALMPGGGFQEKLDDLKDDKGEELSLQEKTAIINYARSLIETQTAVQQNIINTATASNAVEQAEVTRMGLDMAKQIMGGGGLGGGGWLKDVGIGGRMNLGGLMTGLMGGTLAGGGETAAAAPGQQGAPLPAAHGRQPYGVIVPPVTPPPTGPGVAPRHITIPHRRGYVPGTSGSE